MINRNVSWEIVFFVRQGERMERCFYSEVLYVEASGCYCYIYRRDKPRILISYSLLMVELRLPKSMFRRVHRSYSESSGGGWFHREDDLHRRKNNPGQQALPGGGVRVLCYLGVENEGREIVDLLEKSSYLCEVVVFNVICYGESKEK